MFYRSSQRRASGCQASGLTYGLACAILFAAQCSTARAVDTVSFRRAKQEMQVAGKVLVTAKDGGVMLLAPDGMLWNIEPQEIVDHKQDDQPFAPLTQAEAAKHALAGLPAGFEVYNTAHYVFCHNTSRAYAQWVGALYERLYSAFSNYWTRRGFKLHDPELPLVVIIFSTQSAYAAHSQAELGDAAKAIIGYYSLRSNRVTMYDLTGAEALRGAGQHRSNATQINQMLQRPEAESMVATIIHEATHQLAFNCGLQTRYADIPLWVSEGIAVYFETPDLSNAKGWRTIGEVNRVRLDRFREYVGHRPKQSILSLISDDTRFRDSRQALDAYAEAWSLNYFLIRTRPKEFLTYMETLAAKHALIFDKPEDRIRQFKVAFGDDLDKLDADFLKYMQKVR
jgi:hypothetical protein